MRVERAGLLREMNVGGGEDRAKDEGTIDAVSSVAELLHVVRDIRAVRPSPANKDIRDSNPSRRRRDLRLLRTRPLRKDLRSVKAEAVAEGEGGDGGAEGDVEESRVGVPEKALSGKSKRQLSNSKKTERRKRQTESL